MRKPLQIVITGAECSGKSTLAAALAEHYQEPWVREYAVDYLNGLNRAYLSKDLVAIAKGQMASIAGQREAARRVLLIDTGPEVVEIWHRDKIGPLPDAIRSLRAEWSPDLYLLCRPDIPYEHHPQREDPHRREMLFSSYRDLLKADPTVEVYGAWSQRLKQATEAIDSLLSPSESRK